MSKYKVILSKEKDRDKKGKFVKGHQDFAKNKGRIFTKEHRKKLSLAKKGKPSWRKGKKFSKLSEEHKKKIGLAGRGRIVTEETRRKISLANRKEKSYNWQGGIKKKNLLIRKRFETTMWREKVYQRDNFICQKCFQRGGRLHPHHIFNFANYLELRFEVSNGITFCKKCHKLFHDTYGYSNNNLEQITKFIRK